MKVILIHGNGGGSGKDNWFPYVQKELLRLGLVVMAPDFPDAEVAHANVWLPYLEQLGADTQTVLIGHSSGAIAAMRYAETHQIHGSVLVGSYHTDLGDATEKESGYFNDPWDWENIKNHQSWICQFASRDDPYIPIEEARFVHEKLGTEYYEYKSEGHFGSPHEDKTEFPELISILKTKLAIR